MATYSSDIQSEHNTHPGMALARIPGKVVAFFDLDKTIIATSSTFAYGKEFLHSGLITPSDALHMGTAKAMYMLWGHNDQQMDATKDQLTALIRGWDVEQMKEIAEQTLHEVVAPTIYAEAKALIHMHRAFGHDVAIISASASELVEPIAHQLGIEKVVATRLASKNGKFTGEIDFYCKGPAKASAIQQLAEENNYDLEASYAYSDSATDIPMLSTVGHPHAVNPDRALRKHALAHEWPVQTFKNPVPLIPRPNPKEVGLSTGVALSIAGLIGGVRFAVQKSKFRPK